MKCKLLKQSLIFLSIVAFLPAMGCAQQVAATPDSATFHEGSRMTVVGRIDYQKSMGGYYVKAEKPPAVLFIENQNGKKLEKLFKSKKLLTIEGHATAGADYLFIEKIEGNAYKGEVSGVWSAAGEVGIPAILALHTNQHG